MLRVMTNESVGKEFISTLGHMIMVILFGQNKRQEKNLNHISTSLTDINTFLMLITHLNQKKS